VLCNAVVTVSSSSRVFVQCTRQFPKFRRRAGPGRGKSIRTYKDVPIVRTYTGSTVPYAVGRVVCFRVVCPIREDNPCGVIRIACWYVPVRYRAYTVRTGTLRRLYSTAGTDDLPLILLGRPASQRRMGLTLERRRCRLQTFALTVPRKSGDGQLIVRKNKQAV